MLHMCNADALSRPSSIGLTGCDLGQSRIPLLYFLLTVLRATLFVVFLNIFEMRSYIVPTDDYVPRLHANTLSKLLVIYACHAFIKNSFFQKPRMSSGKAKAAQASIIGGTFTKPRKITCYTLLGKK